MISARTLRTSLRFPAVGCWALVGLLLTHPGQGQEVGGEPWVLHHQPPVGSE